MTDHKQPLRDLIEGIRFAMFTTRSREGTLHSRPMTTQNVDINDDPVIGKYLWFFISRSSDTVDELNAEPKVNVSYADPNKDVYVSVSGNAWLIDDGVKKEQLWSKINEVWFPQGIEDPNLALICVKVEEFEYWNVKENKIIQIAKMTKALISGKRPPNMGEHIRVEKD